MDSDRRQFITLVGAALAGWPTLARAQSPRRIRMIGVLMGLADDDEAKRRIKAFEQGLARKKWVVGQNLRIEYRYAKGDPDLMHRFATELVALRPDLIVAHSTPVVAALLEVTHIIPIVFVVVSDPIGSGFAASMARPGGNVTGFTILQPTITGKYLSILSELTPRPSRVTLMYNPESVPEAGAFFTGAFFDSAAEFKVEPIIAEVHSAAEIESAIVKLGSKPGGALITVPDNFLTFHRDLLVALTAKYKIPAIYPYRYFAEAGGLLSYGVDVIDLFRSSTDYVDRILRGANPATLPVQAPKKFEMVINLKTAKALGIDVPRVVLAAADEIIE
jgi:putative tryptophan/tyrosine transport system substrate-binding protein